MNKELQKGIRSGMIFGFAGAAGIPLCYEIYANLGAVFGWFFLLLGAAVAGVKQIKLGAKGSLMSFAVMIPIEAGFGMAAFMVIHPVVKDFIEAHSKYFYLTLGESVKFFTGAAAIQLVAVAVPLAAAGVRLAVRKLRENGEAAGKYIDNAFDEEQDKF